MEYPKVFEECPICHCRERVLENEINEEKKAGRIGTDRIPCSQQKFLGIMDPTRYQIAFPVLKVYLDICANCGFEYPHTIDRDKMTQDQLMNLLRQQMGMGIPPPPGRS